MALKGYPAGMADTHTAAERVKELECLYAIAQALAEPGVTLQEALQRMVNLLPAAWRFSHLADAKVVFDQLEFASYESPNGDEAWASAAITVQGVRRGEILVGYPPGTISEEEVPFLKEEQRLLTEAARQIALFVERLESRQAQETLREQLWHAERLITVGQLASGVAHELNEPLGSILGFAQLLKKTPRLPKAARRDLGKIVAAALHARGIIQKLMLFARQSAPDFSSVALNRLIRDCVGLLVWRCEDEGVQVDYALDTKLPPVVADEAQIRQIVINLVSNAIEAMPGGGTMTIRTRRMDEGIEFSVADSGQGIPPEALPKIFEPFFTTKDVDEGTGLGLSVVHGIVAAHGGEIRVEENSPAGTRVCVRLLCKPKIAQDIMTGKNHADAIQGTDSGR